MDNKAKALIAGAALVAAIVVFRRPAAATEDPYEADFTVLDDDTGQPIQGARVAILDRSVTTNANGEAAIGLQIEGLYDFAVTHAGYEPFEGSFIAE
jgi:hypothetical protein